MLQIRYLNKWIHEAGYFIALENRGFRWKTARDLYYGFGTRAHCNHLEWKARRIFVSAALLEKLLETPRDGTLQEEEEIQKFFRGYSSIQPPQKIKPKISPNDIVLILSTTSNENELRTVCTNCLARFTCGGVAPSGDCLPWSLPASKKQMNINSVNYDWVEGPPLISISNLIPDSISENGYFFLETEGDTVTIKYLQLFPELKQARHFLLGTFSFPPTMLENKTCELRVSPSGLYLALFVVNGTRGVLFQMNRKENLQNSTELKVVYQYSRRDYYARNCEFPVAFVYEENENSRKEYFVHAIEWNQLVYCQLSNGLQSENDNLIQPSQIFMDAGDYFLDSLQVSPSQNSIGTWGWFWHPVGVISVLSFKDWVVGGKVS
jgi:hypothetical protein